MSKQFEDLLPTERVVVPEALTGFLNHGILPFTGRSREIESLVQFWRQVSDEQGLQTVLLVGEAGMGKSRVIDELIPHITHNGGIVLRIKLFTGSTLSLSHLLAKAIRTNLHARALLSCQVEDSIGSVTTALQRLVKLRPLLLVIEDIHWLPSELIMELVGLLEGMSQEYLRVVFVARPVVFDARGVIERYLTTEIAMKGLTTEEVGMLWERLFVSRGEEQCIHILHKISGGNPLALRSALRGAVQSKLIGIETMGGSRWTVLCPLPILQSNIERFVEVLSDGLAAHLTNQELESARQLATLGEIVSPEAAAIMIDSYSSMIERLVHKGIMIPVASISLEIEKKIEQTAYGFTHTLLHRHLLKQVAGNATRLMQVLAKNTPIHSIQPFEQLHGIALDQVPDNLIAETFDNWVKRPPDIWVSHGIQSATTVLNFLKWLLDVAPVTVANIKYREIYLRLTTLMLAHMRSGLQDCQGEAQRYVELTKNPTTTEEASQYLYGCCYMMCIEGEQKGEIPMHWWDEWKRTVEKFPEWKFSMDYMIPYASMLHSTLIVVGDFALLRINENEIMEWIFNENYSDEFREHALLHLSAQYFNFFENEEKYQQRLELIQLYKDFMINKEWANVMFIRNYMPFLFSTGQFRDFQKLLKLTTPLLVSHQLQRGQNQWSYWAKIAETAFGTPIQLASQAAEPYRTSVYVFPKAQQRLAGDTVLFGVLIGEYEWVSEYMLQNKIELANVDLAAQVLLLHTKGEIDQIKTIELQYCIDGPFRQLCELFNANASHDVIVKQFNKIYSKPVLRVHDILILRATNLLLTIVTQQYESALINSLYENNLSSCNSTLQWIKERGLVSFIIPFLNSYQGIIAPAILSQLHQPPSEENFVVMPDAGNPEVIRVTVLGDITVKKPNEEPAPLRGTRNCTLLALLVAVQAMRRPPSPEEFYELASGVKGDLSYAQHMTRNAVSRLKGMIGKNSILRRSGQPRLNMDLVQVDILQVQQKLQQAMKQLAEGRVFQAYDSTKDVLVSIGTKVPYPTQYEPFFEIAREDFENSLRQLVLTVARLLVEEGDYDHAEKILQCGSEVLPQDEELVEHLAKVLVLLNRSAEAERLLAEMAYR
ncbi:MAG: AAA family ATPase [Armatimonadetes bacterium]|nr:AAA family ATPase [Armatimonadota bacterium]